MIPLGKLDYVHHRKITHLQQHIMMPLMYSIKLNELVTDVLCSVEQRCSCGCKYYLSISSAEEQLSNMVQRKTLLGGFFRSKEAKKVDNIAENQETCVHQLRKAIPQKQ